VTPVTAYRVPVMAFDVAPEPASVRHARGWVVAFAGEHGAAREVQARMGLALTEAFTNAVMYGSSDGTGVVRVAADIEGGTFEVVVLDDGAGFRPGRSHGLGAGLSIIAETADAFAIRERVPQGTEVWMRFRLR
jgi:anti-sigma regulatory factor (Ser/Thr protein kinase)